MNNTYLATLNQHERDQHISFEEGPHIYTVYGKQGYTSVTTFVHKHFPHFDAEKIVNTLLSSKKMKDPGNKYHGMTKEQILADWDKNRDQAAAAGTKMHYDIECFYNQNNPQNNSIEYEYFQRFVKDFPELKPYRTEWTVFYEEYRLSGSIDMIFENPDGTLQIYDWKRCKSIEYEAYKEKTAITPCLNHLPDTNFWHYSLQLNLYKTILEHKYGKTVTGLYLICLHPDNPYKSYDRLEVPFLDNEMRDVLAWWKETHLKT